MPSESPSASLDQLAGDLTALARLAEREGDRWAAMAFDDAARLARREQYRALAVIAPLFSATAALRYHSDHASARRFRTGRDQIEGALALADPARFVAHITAEELATALGLEHGQHIALRVHREKLNDENRALRAENERLTERLRAAAAAEGVSS